SRRSRSPPPSSSTCAVRRSRAFPRARRCATARARSRRRRSSGSTTIWNGWSATSSVWGATSTMPRIPRRHAASWSASRGGRAGGRMAVKSKSMATEEIDLNEALEREGITPVETDLGEYIIQLAHERPSHIIAPAIHKTKGQVAELFERELKRPVEADPEELTRIARAELRQKFLQADIGITGANFAVAETGTVVLVTNEGNGRMVTSLPRVHVAVMGAEKVVPSMTDLMVFLAILAKSATGQ